MNRHRGLREVLFDVLLDLRGKSMGIFKRNLLRERAVNVYVTLLASSVCQYAFNAKTLLKAL
jgi:hypothetical protein